MKRSILLPLMAAIIAIGSAFMSPLVQSGWYDSNGSMSGGAASGTITTPSGDEPECDVNNTQHICKILVGDISFNAYRSAEEAETAEGTGPVGLLKYDDPE